MWGARYPTPDFITKLLCIITVHRPGERRDRRLSGSLPRGPRENRARCVLLSCRKVRLND